MVSPLPYGDFVFQAKYLLKHGDIKKKREILSELGSNTTLINKILNVCLPEELEIIKNGIKQEPKASARFEQKNPSINKGRTPSFEVVRPMWLATCREVRTRFAKVYAG